jgi:serine/threonine-protein kinase
VARIFDEARQASVEEAFTKSGSPAAGPVLASTRAALLAAVQAISDGRASACAAHARGEVSADLQDRRMLCLQERAQDAAALVDAFVHADAITVEKAVAAVEQLGDPGACANARLLLDATPPPRERTQQISQIRDQVAQVAALQRSGHFKEGLPKSEQVAQDAQKTGYAPLEAEALLWRGRLLYDGDGKSLAPEVLVSAAGAAMRARRDDLAAAAESSLVMALGWAQKTDDALRWAEHARGVIARAGDDPALRADLLLARGYAEGKVYKVKEALHDQAEALALLEKHAPARLVPAMVTVAGILGNAGRYKEAIALDEKALPLAEKMLGPLHPTTLSIRANHGVMYSQLGDYRPALPILRRTLADRRAALGPEHLDVARSSAALAGALTGVGDYEGAVAAYADYFSIVEKKLGPDHPELIGNLALSSEALARLGRFADAQHNLDRSEALLRKHQGDKAPALGFVVEARATAFEIEGRFADAGRLFREGAAQLDVSTAGHPDIATGKAGEARQLRRAGRAAEAEKTHAALLAAAEKALGPDSKDLIDRLVDEGDDLVALHREGDAKPYFERALKLMVTDGVDPLEVAEVRFSAARAFWPSDHRRALDLARMAQTAVAASTLPRGTLRDDLRGWLAAHQPQ